MCVNIIVKLEPLASSNIYKLLASGEGPGGRGGFDSVGGEGGRFCGSSTEVYIRI